MRSSIVGALEGDAPAARATMLHPTTLEAMASAGGGVLAGSAGTSRLRYHVGAGFSGKPDEYGRLRASGPTLKIRVSLVQFRPWAPRFAGSSLFGVGEIAVSAGPGFARQWIGDAVELLHSMRYTCALDIAGEYPTASPSAVWGSC
jgi:hypothetical protein